MSVLATRLLPLALTLAALANSSDAVAQATINLNTANGSCVAVTDASGLTLKPNSTELQANGVTLSAQQAGACNPAGGASSTFNTAVTTSGSQSQGTPYTPAVGAAFYVIWSASADATACTRGGNFTSGMTGWTIGSSACTGAQCSGSHAEAVTPTAPGNYNFSVTCTNASGYATTSAMNVPAPPTPAPTPNPITLTVPATAVTGSPFSVTWPQMQNAARCNGSGTYNGAAIADLGDWTAVTTVSNSTPNSRAVTVPATSGAGTLVLNLTCWNSDSSASAVGQSSSIAVTAAPIGACPATIPSSTPGTPLTWLKTSNISYGTYPTQRQNVSVTEWDSVWGYNNVTATTPTAWPGVGGSSPVIRQMGRYSYLGVHFKTPAAPASSMNGSFSNPSIVNTLNVDMAISTACGDFSANLPTPGCLVQNVPSSDANLTSWKFSANAPGSWCNLQPNTDYYVNIKFSDPTSTANNCVQGASICPLATVSFHN